MHLIVHIWIILQARKHKLDVAIFGVTNLSDAAEVTKDQKSTTTLLNNAYNKDLNLVQHNGPSTRIVTSVVVTMPENHRKFLLLEGLGGKSMSLLWHEINAWSRCNAPVRMHETFLCHTSFVMCLEGALDYSFNLVES